MNADTMVSDLHRAGIRLSRNGDRPHIEAKPGTITPEIRDRLAANKPELLAWLESPKAIRMRLLALANELGIDATHVHTQDDDDMRECRGLPDDTLRDWLRWRVHWAIPCTTAFLK